jgi:hypothetical protein
MRRPGFPTVISLIALFVALGGTSYAVIKLPPRSVGNRELKSNAVTSAKIRARGLVKRVGGLGPADTIAVLPSGYTPANRTMSAAAMVTGTAAVTSGRLDIEKDGQLRWSGGPSGDPNFVSLDNVSFWTE